MLHVNYFTQTARNWSYRLQPRYASYEPNWCEDLDSFMAFVVFGQNPGQDHGGTQFEKSSSCLARRLQSSDQAFFYHLDGCSLTPKQ